MKENDLTGKQFGRMQIISIFDCAGKDNTE